MQLSSVNRGWFHELKERKTFILQRVKNKLLLCKEGIGWAVSLLCLVPTGRWLSSADTDAAVGLPCTSDFLALGSFCNCTRPPQVSSPFKVSTTIPVQSLHSHSQVRRELCGNAAVCYVYDARGGFQLNEVLAIYSKERLEEGVRRELRCRALQLELGISPLETSCEKNNKGSSCFLFTRGQARQRVGVSPSQMKLARISKKSSVHK